MLPNQGITRCTDNNKKHQGKLICHNQKKIAQIEADV
jgi:hypothetical protein